jgi:hypothetical protein
LSTPQAYADRLTGFLQMDERSLKGSDDPCERGAFAAFAAPDRGALPERGRESAGLLGVAGEEERNPGIRRLPNGTPGPTLPLPTSSVGPNVARFHELRVRSSRRRRRGSCLRDSGGQGA